jgi:NADH-quinone oxidoreductase subunit G/NADP-reducing hydrogenase subunit HndD
MIIYINNKKIEANPKETILEVALRKGIKIPYLSYHPEMTNLGGDRISLVEVEGLTKLVSAETTKVYPGIKIHTNSEKVERFRRLNLELIFASHIEKCADCTLRFNCRLLDLARDYKIKISEFKDRKEKRKTYKFSNAVEIDGSQCIDCGNCIEACALQSINFLQFDGKGYKQEVKPVTDKLKACIYCGQCTNVCPVAAAQEQSQWKEVENILEDKRNVVVAQFAPAARVSIGEEFGLPSGFNCAKKINTALKELGFAYNFDINFGADITTLTEATELIERVNKSENLPMMTSCCPAWVAYVEFYYPELIPNLTTARSPHIHSAGAIKAYFSKKRNIDSKRIKVVSIVPCTAKKHEAIRRELYYQSRPLVDHVLTVREFAFMLKKRQIDLSELEDAETEPLFNDGSGAAAIYGASGGVMESALRTAVFLGEKDKNRKSDFQLEFKEVRQARGIKEATINLGKRKLKVAVVNGISNVSKILPKLKKYHYIEVMTCPGGCLAGGGQPFPTTSKIREERRLGLYNIDKRKKVRRAHENKEMLTYYKWVKDNKLEGKLLHTKFFARKRI